MEDKSLMFYMIRSELEDAVGVENVSTQQMKRAVYSVDYFWLSRKWQDAGQSGPMPDIVVRPGSAEEVSKVLKIANYYKMCISALVSNHRNSNSAGQPSKELVGRVSAVEAEAVFVQVTLELLTSTMVSSGQECLQIA